MAHDFKRKHNPRSILHNCKARGDMFRGTQWWGEEFWEILSPKMPQLTTCFEFDFSASCDLECTSFELTQDFQQADLIVEMSIGYNDKMKFYVLKLKLNFC